MKSKLLWRFSIKHFVHLYFSKTEGKWCLADFLRQVICVTATIEFTLVLIVWKFNLLSMCFFCLFCLFGNPFQHFFLQHSLKAMFSIIGFRWLDILDYIYSIDLYTRSCQTQFRSWHDCNKLRRTFFCHLNGRWIAPFLP